MYCIPVNGVEWGEEEPQEKNSVSLSCSILSGSLFTGVVVGTSTKLQVLPKPLNCLLITYTSVMAYSAEKLSLMFLSLFEYAAYFGSAGPVKTGLDLTHCR